MQFMILLAGDEKIAQSFTKEEGAAMMEAYRKYTDELQKAGVYVTGDALLPTATGARVAVRRGKVDVTDGPFAEAKEVIGGYYIIQVASRDEALAWAKRCPGAQYGDRGAYVEVRQLMMIMQSPQ